MERTVPETINEGIELYIRTYYSLLRSSGDIRVRSLEETHEGMLSSLHLHAESASSDTSAFLYATLRLPACMHLVRRVVLGQSEAVFRRGGLDVTDWQRVDVQACRRRMLFDGVDTVAAFVASVSDIDDLIPSLTAFQIEWNKLHRRLADSQLGHDLAGGRVQGNQVVEALRQVLDLDSSDMERLCRVWQSNWDVQVQALAQRAMDLRVNSLASGFNTYRRAVQDWWDELERAVEGHDLGSRPATVPKLPAMLPTWKVAEDVGQVSGMDGALRLLAGDGVVELILIGWMMRRAVPQGLGGDWAMEDGNGCHWAPADP